MLALPIALISATIAQVLLQKTAESKNNNKQIFPLITNISAILFSLSVVGVLIISFWGNELFVFVFGEQWASSGDISRILVFAFAIKFIVSPLSSIFISLEKIKISSMWQMAYFIVICSLFFLNKYTLEEFLKTYVIIDLIAYSIYYLLILFVVKKYDAQLLNNA